MQRGQSKVMNTASMLQIVDSFNLDIREYDASVLICMVATVLLVSSLSMLFLSTTPLPTWRTSWIQKSLSAVRSFKPTADQDGNVIAKKNQFGIGDLNFNYLAAFTILLPTLFQFVMSPATSLDSSSTNKRKLTKVGSVLGSAGAYAFTFFLIPVARHSVLLASLGWSPVLAMRLHVWAGYVAFYFELAHSIVVVIVWFEFGESPVWEQVFPKKRCWGWTWKPDFRNRKNRNTPDFKCRTAWLNFTGVFATLFFTILILTSLNWVRRRHYRLFYVCHVIFGIATILTAIAHEPYLVIVFVPSIVYYLASTIPTLVQALASRFRGGVRIVQVVDLGGCVEVQAAINEESLAALNSEPSLFVKVCVPQISLVWHPFTVYKHPKDPTTVRLLIRPVGHFTKEFVRRLTAPGRPVTIVDGFYHTSNRAIDALQHDQVTIVVGGAGLSPFLSMIPSLFSNLVVPPKSEVPPVTQSVELHWVCREAPLIEYIQDNYLEEMLDIAHKINSVRTLKFHIVIYCTGAVVKGKVDDMEGSSKTKAEDEDSDQELSNQSPVEENDLKGSNTNEKTPNTNEKIRTMTSGFEMEPARLMPGRYTQVWRNVPAFVGLSFGLWIGLWIMLRWKNKEAYRVNYIYAKTFWGQIITLLVILGFSILMEAAVLLASKYWPAPKRDVFDVAEYLAKENDNVPMVETKDSPSISITKCDGRPCINDLLASARLANAPGVFMCGPKALTDLVKYEAGKENSVYGLTRFCLYDEPSEM